MHPPNQHNTNNPIKNPYRKTAITLTALGIILIIVSLFFEIPILAVISIGIIFWGIIFAFAKTSDVVSTELLNFSFSSTPTVMDKIIQTQNFEKGVYIPPRYFANANEGGVLLLHRGEETRKIEEIAKDKELSLSSEEYYGAFPGMGLVNFLEEKLSIDLTMKGIKFLEDTLMKIFQEQGIAEDIQIKTDGDVAHFRVINPVYGTGCEEVRRHQSFVCTYIGCPFCSALAYALAKATGKIVLIERNELSSGNKIIDLWCRMIESRS